MIPGVGIDLVVLEEFSRTLGGKIISTPSH